jgi:hypothetical protein
MPLDQDARKYADLLYLRGANEARQKYDATAADTKAAFAIRDMRGSGPHISRLGKDRVDYVHDLIATRSEGLLAAYEAAGIAIDDQAVEELATELQIFAHDQAVDASKSLQQDLAQVLHSDPNPDEVGLLLKEFRRMAQDNVPAILRDIRIKRTENLLAEKRALKVYAAATGKGHDVFISHATADKSFVRQLQEALIKSGLDVWLDETNLTVGDSLRRKIDEALSKSRYGIVVLSHAFFSKEWPQQELNGLFGREIASVKVILPIWHEVTAEEVRKYSPMLADRVAVKSSQPMDVVVARLRAAMGLS